MRWPNLWLLTAVLALAGCGQDHPTVYTPHLPPDIRSIDVRIDSQKLGHPTTYRVFAPAHIDHALPVLYLLHGSGGVYDGWPDNAFLLDLPARGFLVVTPGGENSWWTDPVHRSELMKLSNRYESYLTKELPADLARRFPVRAGRDYTAMAGISMGGVGAVNLALRHPELYAFAAGLSGPYDVPERFHPFRKPRETLMIRRLFGAAGSPVNLEHDPYTLAGQVNAASAPYFYLTCGDQEMGNLEDARRLDAILQKRGIAHSLHVLPGAHDFAEWNRAIPGVEAALLAHIPHGPAL